ncbi:hypothetical protein ACFV9C_33275 [Kribbella sp. NPDC059898]|uniref:hypothetical protein n=1 Tax=Kribbella sp. NPDC059898 TaxID=3346995 RepID=UPI0036587246
MTVAEAKSLACRVLADELPRRWAHTQGVAGRARTLAPILGDRSELIEVAGYMHLRDVVGADAVVCQLVAHHSGAAVEADERGIDALGREFAVPEPGLLHALTYCDLTADVNGRPVSVEERLGEILTRYPRGHVVHRSVVRSSPALRSAVVDVQQRLSA